MSLPDIGDPEKLSFACRALRESSLFSEDTAVATPECEQYYLLALAALDQAERFAMLAEYKRRRGE